MEPKAAVAVSWSLLFLATRLQDLKIGIAIACAASV